MLTPEERREIADEMAHYPDARAASIEALKVVQRHRGWVSDEALADVAAALGITADDLDGVATFYNLIFRRPVGRRVVLLCDSVSCWVEGYEGIQEHFKARYGVDFGQTTPDGAFTLLPVPCLGACDRGPCMMVGPELHTRLTPEKVDAALRDAEARR